jgi:hypothetical protein
LLSLLFLIAVLTYVSSYILIFRGYGNGWGSTAGEASRLYPGEDAAVEAKVLATHAVDVNAPPETVWRYVAQIGQGRAGFYSYDWLENLVGCDIHNVYTVREEWQHPTLGQPIYLAPGFGMPLRVFESNRAFVMGMDSRNIPDSGDGSGYMAATWGLYLEANDPSGTRLVSRMRADHSGGFGYELMSQMMLWADFFMDRRMLLTIRDLAEKEAGNSQFHFWEEEHIWFWSLIVSMLLAAVGFLSRIKLWFRILVAILESFLILCVFYFLHPIWLAGLALVAVIGFITQWERTAFMVMAD